MLRFLQALAVVGGLALAPFSGQAAADQWGGDQGGADQGGADQGAACHGGCPILAPWEAPADGLMVVRETHVLRNNPATKFADWVAYRVSVDGMTLPPETKKPKRRWKRDPDLPAENTLAPKDYKGAHKALGTDRGHQAPLASFYGYSDVQMTNYLSNITPQRSGLNQGPWRILEERVRDLAARGVTVSVVTGPLYERDMPALPNASKPHRVPSGYWKVVLLDPDIAAAGDEAVAGFVMDQDLPRKADFCATAVTVDGIEARSGYDLFPALDHDETFESGLGTLYTALGCDTDRPRKATAATASAADQ
ncbi:MAG: DNA/RNA non-specific endonuclease [Alphaproteobacteria bacterium]|nr:DNA/RNA non-specific endonuclease [Alphaproteobacteria bacterium]